MSLSRVRWEVWTSHTLFSSFTFTTQAKKHSIINCINFCIALLYPNTFYNRYSRTLDISVLSFINGEKNAVPVKNVPAQCERLAARVNDWSHSWKEEWGMSAKYTADSDSRH